MSSNRDIGALQSGSGLDIGALQSPSISILTFTFSDSLSFLDSFTIVGPPNINVTVGDSINNFLDALFFGGGSINLVISDTVSLSDAVSLGTIQPAFLFIDALTIQDSNQLNLLLPYTLNDSLSFNDSSIVQNLFIINEFISDGINVQDSIVIQENVVIQLTFNDSLTFTDVLFLFISIPLRFGDVIPPYLDFVQRGGTNGLSLSVEDFYILGDSITLNNHLRMVFNETLNFNDGISLQVVSTSMVFGDILSLNDSITISLSIPVNLVLNDAFSFNDGISIDVTQSLNSYIRRYLNDVV